MLSKFTILACYCIYFSDSNSKYKRMFDNISRLYRTDNDTHEQIAEAACFAIELMQPVCGDGRTYLPVSLISYRTTDITTLQKKLKQIEDNYKNAEWGKCDLCMQINKEKIEKLRKQIGDAHEAERNE